MGKRKAHGQKNAACGYPLCDLVPVKLARVNRRAGLALRQPAERAGLKTKGCILSRAGTPKSEFRLNCKLDWSLPRRWYHEQTSIER